MQDVTSIAARIWLSTGSGFGEAIDLTSLRAGRATKLTCRSRLPWHCNRGLKSAQVVIVNRFRAGNNLGPKNHNRGRHRPQRLVRRRLSDPMSDALMILLSRNLQKMAVRQLSRPSGRGCRCLPRPRGRGGLAETLLSVTQSHLIQGLKATEYSANHSWNLAVWRGAVGNDPG